MSMWNQILCIACVLAVLSLGSAWAGAKEPLHYTQLTFEDVPDIPRVEPKSYDLANKARLFVLEDHELPLVQIRIIFRHGQVMIPEGGEGLGRIVAQAVRNGGSKRYPRQELNAMLENRAANLSVSVDFESIEVTLGLLRPDLEDLLPVLTDLLAHPRLPQAQIQLAKRHLLTSIARRNDDQQDVAFREFKRLIYGPDTVYGRLPQVETVQAITKDDVRDFHRQAFTASNMLIGVVGDVQADEVKALLASHLEQLPSEPNRALKFPQVHRPDEIGWHFIHMPGVNQVSLLVGHVGGKRQDPDYAALQLMNSILSGGFSSRLFQELRTQQGLAYSVYGRYGSNAFYPGIFLAGLKTQSQNTVRAVQGLKRELSRLQQEGVTAKELEKAKEEFINSLVFRYDTPEDIMGRQMYYVYRDMPEDSFERLVREIKAVTVADVNRVARESIHMDHLQWLLVGNRQQMKEQLKQLPAMQVIDLQ